MNITADGAYILLHLKFLHNHTKFLLFGIRPDAVVTNSAEAQRAAADAAAGDLLAKPLRRREVDVDDGVTPFADKMRVGVTLKSKRSRPSTTPTE